MVMVFAIQCRATLPPSLSLPCRSGSRLITCEADKTIKIWKEDEKCTEQTHPVDWKPTILRKSRF